MAATPAHDAPVHAVTSTPVPSTPVTAFQVIRGAAAAAARTPRPMADRCCR